MEGSTAGLNAKCFVDVMVGFELSGTQSDQNDTNTKSDIMDESKIRRFKETI